MVVVVLVVVLVEVLVEVVVVEVLVVVPQAVQEGEVGRKQHQQRLRRLVLRRP